MGHLDEIVSRYETVEGISESLVDKDTLDKYFREVGLEHPLSASAKNSVGHYEHSSYEYIASTFLLSHNISEEMISDYELDQKTELSLKNQSRRAVETGEEFLNMNNGAVYRKKDYSLLLRFYGTISQELGIEVSSDRGIGVITQPKEDVRDELDTYLDDIKDFLENTDNLTTG